jgi:hypothetical protein
MSALTRRGVFGDDTEQDSVRSALVCADPLTLNAVREQGEPAPVF